MNVQPTETLNACGRGRSGGCAPVESDRLEFPPGQVVVFAKASTKAFALHRDLVPETRQ